MSRSRRTPEISLGSFNHVGLDGSNAGATMFVRRGMAGEPEGCCCINIFTNGYVQGTNDSVLLGCKIKMKNSGVHLYFGDLKVGEGSSTSRSSRRTTEATVEFGNMVSSVFIPLVTFLLLTSLLM